MRTLCRLVLLALLIAAGVAGESTPLRVVATTSILADLVRQVGGTRVLVHSLVRPGADAHVYQPTPADVASLAGARLVVLNGLGFEGWIDALIKQSGFTGPEVVACSGVEALSSAEDAHGDHPGLPGADPGKAHAGHVHGAADPHAWHDVRNALLYVTNIRDALVALDPAGAADYRAWADLYSAQLRALDAWARRQIAALPEASRVLVTAHDSLAYFAKAYGMRVLAVEGIATGQEPDARHLAALLKRLREGRIKAVFIENVVNPKLIEQLARDGGARLGGTLYTDSLGEPGGPAGTYIGMIAANVRTIVAGLSAE